MKHINLISKILIILAELCAYGLTVLMSWHGSHDVVTTVFSAMFAGVLIILHDINAQTSWKRDDE